MKRLLMTLAITSLIGNLVLSNPTAADPQVKPATLAPDPKAALLPPPAKMAEHVQITKGPALERAWGNWAIIRWTSNNPGGTDQRWGVVHYGTDPKDLSQVARSPIRLNRGHPDTIFRVRVLGLKPQTNYYYTVDSMQASGKSDGVKSPVASFSTLQ
jgi:hypothetical protein